MTEKLGVLLVDVPEPKRFYYMYVMDIEIGGKTVYTTDESDDREDVIDDAYKCIQEEAKKYPQFRWVALEELE
ncbi:hypothetical protein HCC27_08795 [Streptococcus suis]|uniref:Uncharacterized protein n=1 Tax=Streptococcus suis 6407 TaxID=1214179 RepID=A0A075SD71_STRSU|nr:hypothetical protein [Streptococcus suis]AIG43312.1 hypothetical protein ID09_04400 [Streptococcus suis 6407]MCK3921925.1 hypothetical protein [Streptococcus suis]NQG50927.1 hypothetical protein [Streptococcus suis]NQI28366.1 hypothetical protein [Streptococcus suis]UUM54442.1 hypothetical protein NQZ92_04875 [Streptococcus suis]